jgi:hypothetical protein
MINRISLVILPLLIELVLEFYLEAFLPTDSTQPSAIE